MDSIYLSRSLFQAAKHANKDFALGGDMQSISDYLAYDGDNNPVYKRTLFSFNYN